MRELTEQEKEAKLEAWQNYQNGNERIIIADLRGFSAGFAAALEYQQVKLDAYADYVSGKITLAELEKRLQ